MMANLSPEPAAIKISIVTAVRNGMPFVEQTINSVISQDYANIEYIVIDGGSTDGTIDIIRAHESGMAQWVSEPDDGIADAFNKGLSRSTGDYILILNSDDALARPVVLSEVAGWIAKKHFPSIVYGDCNIVDRETAQFRCRATIPFQPKALLRGKMLPHPAMFASRDYFAKYGLFDRQYRIAMDYEWLLRGAFRERVEHIPVLVSNVRTGGVSTRNQRLAEREIIAALRKNGLVSRWGGFAMQQGFLIRSVVKQALIRIGLYKVIKRA